MIRLKISQKHHNEENVIGKNWEDKNDLLGKTDKTATVNGNLDMLTEDTSQKGLLANKSLSALREEWFSSYEFSADTRISDIKYKHPGSKHNNSFYFFND